MVSVREDKFHSGTLKMEYHFRKFMCGWTITAQKIQIQVFTSGLMNSSMRKQKVYLSSKSQAHELIDLTVTGSTKLQYDAI
jgi:hypothetical protein